MTDDLVLLFAIAAALALVAWVWRRFNSSNAFGSAESPQSWQPCWEETEEGAGGHRYGRYQCVNPDLIEMDARAARGDFLTPPAV